MAYVDKYQAGWHSNHFAGTLTISEEGYGGGVTDLILRQDQLTINYSFTDWENPIIGVSCEFSIQNDGADFFDYMELMYAEERKFKITVETITPSVETLFVGFLNSVNTSQKYLKYQPIKLTASTFLSKLQYTYPTIVDTLEMVSFIDIIDNILNQTGAAYDIYVNCSLYSTIGTIGAGQTLFNKHAIYTELFWEDNVERKDSLSILKSILISFNCYIYWYDNKWYIERYGDIKTGVSISYVKYTTGVSYTYDSVGSVFGEIKIPATVASLKYTEMTQTIHVNPGFQKIRILLNDNLLFNMVVNDLSEAANTTEDNTTPAPLRRTWQKLLRSGGGFPTWSALGESYSIISNSIKRNGFWWDAIDGFIHSAGIYTTFIATVVADTQLTIKWKQVVIKGAGEWDEYTFKFHWYLKLPFESSYVVYNELTEVWELIPATDLTGIQTIEIEGTAMDQSTSSGEPSVTINLGEAAALIGDTSFVLCIGQETFTRPSTAETAGVASWIGDVVVTSTGAFQNNVITGEANTAFLGKKDVPIDIFDAGSYNYKNAIMTGEDYTLRTELWTEDGVNFWSIADWLLRDKFQLWNQSRQQLQGTIKKEGLMRPLTIYTDLKQANMQFLLLGYSWNVMADEYRNAILGEYDTTTDINLT